MKFYFRTHDTHYSQSEYNDTKKEQMNIVIDLHERLNLVSEILENFKLESWEQITSLSTVEQYLFLAEKLG